MRTGIVLVLPGQLAEGRNIGLRLPEPLEGVAVALPLVMPADAVHQRLQEHAENRKDEHDPGLGPDRQCGIVQRLPARGRPARQQAVADPESGHAEHQAEEDHLADVAENMMPDLVGEDHGDLRGREIVQERIAQQHPPRAAQAGQHGVGLDRFLAQGDAVNAFDRQAGAGGQSFIRSANSGASSRSIL